MNPRKLNQELLETYRLYLRREEKSYATIDKYMRDVSAFAAFCGGEISKETAVAYKQKLLDSGYAISSINSMLASLNSLFRFLGWEDLRVKALKQQRRLFCPEEKELTREEYRRLCSAAEASHRERLSLLLQTICATGIRVSELQYITAEAARSGKAEVTLKGKTRTIFLPRSLQKKLRAYAAGCGIRSGPIFVTRSGKPMGRTAVWREMKSLCAEAGVDPRKVFPHNLRHLFARAFYSIRRDIVLLADVLGHSSVNTTRIYIASTGVEHLRCMERMQMVI